MTVLTDTRRRLDGAVPERVAATTPWTVVGFAVLAVAMRLPYLGTPMSSDEGGFLYLAQHWSEGGSSLYGRYWVDRPPLLLMLFRIGDLLGGLTGLRVVGCLAAAVTVLALGLAAQRVLGPRAATWTAAAACLTITAPLLGAVNVNGELLALPFVARGILACVGSVTATSDGTRIRAAFVAGVCAAAAVMVKQNFVDVVVFAVVLTGATWRLDRPRTLLGLRQGFSFLAGAGAGLGAVLTVAAAHGTSPGGVFFAMYPFRVRAAGLMGHLPLTDRLAHLDRLGTAWVASGVPLLLGALVVVMLARRLRPPMALPLALATLGLAAYDVFSIGAGGSYWAHYLVQLVPATALTAGLLGSSSRVGRALVAAMLLLTGASWAFGMAHRVDVPGQSVGAAIGGVSRPGDTIVSLLGSGDIDEASGLTTPYRYLWSLPSRTLDPRMTLLARVLDGTQPPTWVVVRGTRTFAEIAAAAPGPALTDRYQRLPDVCGRRIYLRDGVQRAAPSATNCRRPLSSLLDETTETSTTGSNR